MIIKEKFELLKYNNKLVDNIVDLPDVTLNALSIDVDDKKFIYNNILAYAKTTNFYNVVKDHLDQIFFIRAATYPLIGFVTFKGRLVVNLNVIAQHEVLNMRIKELYATVIYTISLSKFLKKRPFNYDLHMGITNYFFALFMSIYAKKHGLIGTYSSVLPNMKFLISLYIDSSFFGKDINIKLKTKTAAMFNVNLDTINANFNFDKIDDLISAFRVNDIIHFSKLTFTNDIVTRSGIQTLPAMEDISRFFSTILIADLKTQLLTAYLVKVNAPLFKKLNYIAVSQLKKK